MYWVIDEEKKSNLVLCYLWLTEKCQAVTDGVEINPETSVVSIIRLLQLLTMDFS